MRFARTGQNITSPGKEGGQKKSEVPLGLAKQRKQTGNNMAEKRTGLRGPDKSQDHLPDARHGAHDGVAAGGKRQVTAHRRRLNSVSIFNPAPIRATRTTNSVIRSAIWGNSSGLSRGVTCTNEKSAAPSATHTIGSESGRRFKTRGSQATRAIRKPMPVRTTISNTAEP